MVASISINKTWWLDTRYILSFGIKEQLKIVLQNMHEVKQSARPHIAAASCERYSTRQWSHNTMFKGFFSKVALYLVQLVQARAHLQCNDDIQKCGLGPKPVKRVKIKSIHRWTYLVDTCLIVVLSLNTLSYFFNVVPSFEETYFQPPL